MLQVLFYAESRNGALTHMRGEGPWITTEEDWSAAIQPASLKNLRKNSLRHREGSFCKKGAPSAMADADKRSKWRGYPAILTCCLCDYGQVFSLVNPSSALFLPSA